VWHSGIICVTFWHNLYYQFFIIIILNDASIRFSFFLFVTEHGWVTEFFFMFQNYISLLMYYLLNASYIVVYVMIFFPLWLLFCTIPTFRELNFKTRFLFFHLTWLFSILPTFMLVNLTCKLMLWDILWVIKCQWNYFTKNN
jgi:hypothetical protein